MDDHPDIRGLRDNVPVEYHQIHPARDGLLDTLSTAINMLIFTLLMVAVPVIVWLWRWAL
jgi:hypothetical protein